MGPGTKFDLNALNDYSLFSVSGEDVASLLTSHITFIALILTAAFLSGFQLLGQPIECWCPAELTDAMCNYTKSICWVSKQFVIDFEDAIPMDPLARGEVQKRALEYYPMIPFILLIIALALNLPSFLWAGFQAEDGLNIPKAVNLAVSTDRSDEESCQDILFEMIFRLENLQKRNLGHSNLLSVKKVMTAFAIFPLGGNLGTYQTGLFLAAKLLSVIIILLVFVGLGFAFQLNFTIWGLNLLKLLITDGLEPDLYTFPREALCDFQVRQLQNVHRFTVQCVLPINMWSEKVFLILWGWLLLLLLINIYSYQYWIRKVLIPSNRLQFINKHLTISNKNTQYMYRDKLTQFALKFLSHDSILELRILEMAAGNRFTNVLVSLLWEEFRKKTDLQGARDMTGPD